MSISSLLTGSGAESPWQALHDLRDKNSASSSQSASGAEFFTLPPSPDASASTDTADSGSSSDIADSSAGSGDLSSAVTQLIDSLQAFLVNLQSAGDASSTTASATDATSVATSTDTTAATASTDPTTSTDPSATFADFVNNLENAFANPAGSQTSAAADSVTADGSTITADASATDNSTDPNAPPHGPDGAHGDHHLLAEILSAAQSYAASSSQTAVQGTATTSTTA